MNTKYKTTLSIVLVILNFSIHIPAYSHQDNPEGLWEGMFMDQFKMEFYFVLKKDMAFTGKIRMYDGSNVIQDDEITNIELENETISFMIPAKETVFEGQANADLSQIRGEFIFPDGSRHPVHVIKKGMDNQTKDLTPAVNKSILTREYAPEQLMEDLMFLREHLSELHPQYHLYASEEAYDALYKSIIQNLGSGLTLIEYYNLVYPVINKIGCSHTGIRLPDEYTRAQQRYNHYFPVKVYVENEKAWVVGSMDDQEYIVPGSEIVSINNISMENIVARLLSLIPAEGYNKTTKYFEINRDFGSWFNLMNNSGQFQIEYTEPGNPEIHTVNIESIPFVSYNPGIESVHKDLPAMHILNNELNTAVIEIKSFTMPDVNEYLHLMDSIFGEIQKQEIDNLIIDLRGNQGGHPIFAAIFYSYLTSEDFIYFRPNEEIPEFEPLYRSMEPAMNNFKGKCYVLVDGGCLSTTGHLISLLRFHERAVFIGEEPGSWFYCNDNSQKFKLPNTHIEVNIPRTTFMTDVKGYKMGKPFKVDHPLTISVEDRILGKDTWLEFSLTLIRSSDSSF